MTNDVGRARAAMLMDVLKVVFGISWEPELYEPGYHHDDAWVIASESGPEDWTQRASMLVNRVPGNGLYVEAMNHWSIVVFPDGDVPADAAIVLDTSDEPARWSDVAPAHDDTVTRNMHTLADRLDGLGQIRMGTADYRRPEKLGW